MVSVGMLRVGMLRIGKGIGVSRNWKRGTMCDRNKNSSTNRNKSRGIEE